MGSVSLFTGSGEGQSFSYNADAPTYYTEKLSWVILKNLERLNDAGFELSFPDSTDLSTYEAEMTTWVDSVGSWLETAFAQRQEGARGLPILAPPVLPSLLAKGKAALSLLAPVLLEKALDVVTLFIEKKFEADQEIDFTQLSDVLRTAFIDGEGKPLITQISGGTGDGTFVPTEFSIEMECAGRTAKATSSGFTMDIDGN